MTPRAQPLNASTALFKRLSDAASRDVPSEFEVRRLKQDAEPLMASDPGEAHQILGGLATIERDEEAMRSHHEQALRFDHRPSAYSNYAISLQRFGRFSEAVTFALIAAEAQPENLALLRRVLRYHVFSGNLTAAVAAAETLRRRAPEDSDPMIKMSEDIKRILEIRGIDESEWRQSVEIAFDLLAERKLGYTRTDMRVFDEPGEEGVTLYILVDLPIEAAVELDCDLSSRLAERLPVMHSHLSVMISPRCAHEPDTAATV